MKTIILVILFVSCSAVNRESQVSYQSKNEAKHGLQQVQANQIYKPSLTINNNPKVVAQGKKLYQSLCMSCHGIDGEGNGPLASDQKVAPTNLKAAVNEIEHFAFYTRFSYWDGSMPGWDREFTKAELDAITAYLYSFKSK